MLPDTFVGGLIMTLVNMTVVFLVLGFLALVIKATAGAITRLAPEVAPPPPRSVLVVSSHSEAEEGDVFLPDNIDPAKKAAILAAISVYLGKPETGMFLRDTRDSGAWGRLSRRQAYANSGYRSGQTNKDRQLLASK